MDRKRSQIDLRLLHLKVLPIKPGRVHQAGKGSRALRASVSILRKCSHSRSQMLRNRFDIQTRVIILACMFKMCHNLRETCLEWLDKQIVRFKRKSYNHQTFNSMFSTHLLTPTNHPNCIKEWIAQQFFTIRAPNRKSGIRISKLRLLRCRILSRQATVQLQL